MVLTSKDGPQGAAHPNGTPQENPYQNGNYQAPKAVAEEETKKEEENTES